MERFNDMARRAKGNMESLASTLLVLGDAEKFQQQEMLARAIQNLYGMDFAMEVDDRYVELVRKFG